MDITTTPTKAWTRGCIQEAKEQGATHLIIVMDLYDHEYYPIVVSPDENMRTAVQEFPAEEVKVVYDLKKDLGDLDRQLDATYWPFG